MMEDDMSSSALPGELEEISERLKNEFGIDRLGLSPEIEDRLLQLQQSEQEQADAGLSG